MFFLSRIHCIGFGICVRSQVSLCKRDFCITTHCCCCCYCLLSVLLHCIIICLFRQGCLSQAAFIDYIFLFEWDFFSRLSNGPSNCMQIFKMITTFFSIIWLSQIDEIKLAMRSLFIRWLRLSAGIASIETKYSVKTAVLIFRNIAPFILSVISSRLAISLYVKCNEHNLIE